MLRHARVVSPARACPAACAARCERRAAAERRVVSRRGAAVSVSPAQVRAASAACMPSVPKWRAKAPKWAVAAPFSRNPKANPACARLCTARIAPGPALKRALVAALMPASRASSLRSHASAATALGLPWKKRCTPCCTAPIAVTAPAMMISGGSDSHGMATRGGAAVGRAPLF
jgi:hypothetical protein